MNLSRPRISLPPPGANPQINSMSEIAVEAKRNFRRSVRFIVKLAYNSLRAHPLSRWITAAWVIQTWGAEIQNEIKG